MFELVVKNEDGSVYWREHFNSRDDLIQWLKEEESRPYWKKSYTSEVIEHKAPVISEEDKAKREAVKTQLKDLKARLDELDSLDDLTAAQVKELVRKVMRYIKLKGLTD